MIQESLLTESSMGQVALDERPGFGARFWSSGMTRLGLGLLTFLVLFSFVGPLIYRHSAIVGHLLATDASPSAQFPLGTDSIGHNVLAQLMVGGQSSLEVGFAAALVAMIWGTVYGLTSGMVGGVVDTILMRIVDILLSVPAIFILLFLNVVFQPSIAVMILVLASTSWLGVSRLVRAEAMSIKGQLYVEAARATGTGVWRIMMRYLLPNFLGTVLVAATFQVADAILAMAGLSFLGLGLPPPTPNWGGMLADGMNYMFQNSWWLIYPPGLCILIAQVSINLIGDGLRSAIETRER